MTPTKILSLFLCFCLILEQPIFAQAIDLSRYFVHNSNQNIPQGDKFRPLHLRYISYDNQANDFKILLDKGDFFNQRTDKTLELEQTTQELMKYFFVGLALPNEKFWVNLRPDSPDNILDPDLEKTDIGRIFLEADLQLKKDTSSMTSPQNPEGKAYWDKLYKKAGELFGSENITIPTITRPWIVPNEIIIREAPDNAYIYKATLKVMLEEDYLASRGGSRTAPTYQQYAFSDPRLKELNQYSTQLIKETIIPKLTYAVNTSKRYAPLRQVYYSLILAQWFKQKYGSSGSIRAPGARAPVNSYVGLIDSGNLANLTSKEPYDKQTYFQQYQKSFQDGEYNLQEPVYTPLGQSIRRYTSGGIFMSSSGVVTYINVKKREKSFVSSAFAVSYEFKVSSSIRPYEGKGGSPLGDPAQEMLSKVISYLPEKDIPFIRDDIKDILSMLIQQNVLMQENKEDIESLLIFIGSQYTGNAPLVYKVLRGLIITRLIKAEDIKYIQEMFRQIIEMSPAKSASGAYKLFHILFSGKNESSLFILNNFSFIAKNPILIYLLYGNEPVSLLNNNLESQDHRLSGKLLESYKQKESLFVLRRYAWEISDRYHSRVVAYFLKDYYKDALYREFQEAQARHLGLQGAVGFTRTYIDKISLLALDESARFTAEQKEDSFTVVITRLGMRQIKGLVDEEERSKIIKEGLRRKIPVNISLHEEEGSDEFIDFFKKRYPEHFVRDSTFRLAILETKTVKIPIYTTKRILEGKGSSVKISTDTKPIRVSFIGTSRDLSRVFYDIEGEVVSICLDIDRSKRFIEKQQLALEKKFKEDPGSVEAWYYLLGNKSIRQLIAVLAFDGAPSNVGGHVPAIREVHDCIQNGTQRLQNDFRSGLSASSSIGEHIFTPSSDISSPISEVERFVKPLMDEPIKGGIAFNSLPIQTESVASSVLGALPGARAFVGDLDAEWTQIQQIFNAGIRPSIQRISEYTTAVSSSPLAEDKIDQVRVMLADILRRDEESQKLAPAEESCKQLLRALENVTIQGLVNRSLPP